MDNLVIADLSSYGVNTSTIPELLEEAMKSSAIKGVRFVEEYPDSEVSVPTVVWSVYRRIKGKEGLETKKPRLRGGQFYLNSSTMIDMAVQWETVIYQFDFFAATNAKVRRLLEDWETFVEETKPMISRIGIDNFLFDEQLRDYMLPVPREIPNRSLRYEATFSVFRPISRYRIKSIERYISVQHLDREDTAQVLAITRGSTDSDLIPLLLPAILTLADHSGAAEPDYIAGVDFDLTGAQDGNQTTVTWTRAGKRPAGGSTYYVMHSDLDAFSHQIIT